MFDRNYLTPLQKDAIRQTMATPAGRETVALVLGLTGVLTNGSVVVSPAADLTQVNEGRRLVGIDVIHTLLGVAPGELAQLFKEQIVDHYTRAHGKSDR